MPPPTPRRRSPMLLGWSSLLLASVSCTAADSEGNAKTHDLKEQFVPPHSHEAPYAADYREKYHWPPRKVTTDEKRTVDHEEIEPEIKAKNTLQKIEERILERGGDKVDGGRLEKRGSFVPALRKAPLVVQVFALLQLSISLAALGVSVIQGSKILFPSLGVSDAWHTESDPYASASRHPRLPE
ncbi:uncharacterized protein LOC127000093 [Eriocheir sinensis]|uniref:uncharacterized protein LOC127000093 n=1 Tax=Eriocheir sinensis TaxID=95602 RepID=UPI0021C82E29|nr:uncharacterized protein LOC127000093 [Eriocheir sinensis]